MFGSSKVITPKPKHNPGIAEVIATSIEAKFSSVNTPLEELSDCISNLEELITVTLDSLPIHKETRQLSGISDQDNFIEYLRRIAELALLGEKAETTAALIQGRNPNKFYEEIAEENIEAHLCCFEHFCERNALALIVNVATGEAFDGVLPPFAVAIQAVQSVAILIQNVSSETSLFYLLSNNLVNEMIDLPIKKFFEEEYCSELCTNFISFLKSLTMRINMETVQFFLSDLDFPLYRRALDFCNHFQDGFVRVTAMNICLNTCFFANNLEQAEKEKIKRFVEKFERVEQLVTPIFQKLTQFFLKLQEILLKYDMHDMENYYDDCLYRILFDIQKNPLKKKKKPFEGTDGFIHFTRSPLLSEGKTKTFPVTIMTVLKGLIADMQDELLLLDDVFALNMFNDQVIEIMLATFVYPFLLHPFTLNKLVQTQEDNITFVKGHPFQAFKEYSEEQQDLCSLKTCLFGLGALFHVITNKELLKLIFVAIFHPLSPSNTAPSDLEKSEYVLKPALQTLSEQKSSDNTLVKSNPYRTALLECCGYITQSDTTYSQIHQYRNINNTNINRLAYFAIDAALTSQESLEILSHDEDLETVTKTLAKGIMTSSISINEIWRFDYNSIAAHSLLNLLGEFPSQKGFILEVLETTMKQCAEYIVTCSIKNSLYMKISLKNEDVADLYFDEILIRILHFQLLFRSDKSILYSQQSTYDDASIVITASNSSFWATTSLEKNDFFHSHEAIFEQDSQKNGLLLQAALNTASTIQLDAIISFLQKKKSKLQHALWNYDPDFNNPNQLTFQSGQIVSLVGRAAFACVGEVSDENAHLFTDDSSCVIADGGVKWQSLYLVVVGRYMILAEPEKRGCGGNGKIVTSCQLSCLSIERDKPTVIHTSPARRLILTCTSLNQTPPGVFKNITQTSNKNTNLLWQSRMDLWFEDEDSCENAYDGLWLKILKTRCKRGKCFRDVFSLKHFQPLNLKTT